MYSFVLDSCWQLSPFQGAGLLFCSPAGPPCCAQCITSLPRWFCTYPEAQPAWEEFSCLLLCSAREGAREHTDARCDDERFTALCLSIPSCKMGKISFSLNFGGVKFVTFHKGRSCCRNGLFVCVCIQLMSCFQNYHCSELGFTPHLLGLGFFFFAPHSYGNFTSPSAKHLQAL